MVRVMKNDPSKTIKCDSLIINRVFDKIPQNIIYKQSFQMVHGCKDVNPYTLPEDKGQIICVSEAVKNSFEANNALADSRLVF